MARSALRLVTALALALAASGCNQHPGGTTGQVTIGETSCVYCAVGNTAKLAFVVWIDEPDRAPARGIGGKHPFHGEFRLKDGRALAWNCSSRDGKRGRVEIAGLTHDLEQGGLFLVSTRAGGTRVQQLPIEIVGGEIRAANEKLESLAKKDPRIAAFVAAARGR